MPRCTMCGIVLGTIVMQSRIGHTAAHSPQPVHFSGMTRGMCVLASNSIAWYAESAHVM